MKNEQDMERKNTVTSDTRDTREAEKASHGNSGRDIDFNLLDDLDMNDIEER
jgi:hypothetical protein